MSGNYSDWTAADYGLLPLGSKVKVFRWPKPFERVEPVTVSRELHWYGERAVRHGRTLIHKTASWSDVDLSNAQVAEVRGPDGKLLTVRPSLGAGVAIDSSRCAPRFDEVGP